ncbi:uncharacterized protein LOC128952036 [Oppia nitens]|uniref:uncharacterized protein LOC128952036 n=1 Tax=Oppia nitens TaxID=1686743 RepID=UPI0023DC6C1C|nr:uncharacterized protein LOC128952036 [Oppia nitens]
MNRFKILFELNQQKYSVYVDSDYKVITFKTVLNQINGQHKQCIDLDTHSVEIFDKDFEEYVVITSENQIIDNLSRLRVKKRQTSHILNNELTTKSDDNTEDKTNSTNENVVKPFLPENVLPTEDSVIVSDGAADKDIDNNIDKKSDKNITKNTLRKMSNIDTNNVKQNNDLLSKSKELSDDSNSSGSDGIAINGLEDDNRCDDIKYMCDKVVGSTGDEPVIESKSNIDNVIDAIHAIGIKNANKAQEVMAELMQAMNYLDIELTHSYRTSSDCLYLHYKTHVIKVANQSVIAIRYRYDDFRAIILMIDLINTNRRCFEKNPSDDFPENNPKWMTISDQMIINGFDDWSPQKCFNGFKCAMDLYKKSLDKCPDQDTAEMVNPIFTWLNWFDIKYVVDLSEFEDIRDLRQSFAIKRLEKRKIFVSKKFPSNTSLNSNVSNNCLEKRKLLVSKKFPSNTSLNSNVSITSNIWSLNEQKIHNKYGSQQSLVSNCSSYKQKSPQDYQKVKTRSKLEAIEQSNLMKLNRVSNFSQKRINEFKLLAKCVDTITSQLGNFSRLRNFWELVSNEMTANGENKFDSEMCRSVFTEFVCDYYALTLTHSSDERTASNAFPLFSLIHSMDLSQSLSTYSYEKIKNLREKFTSNCLK